jgi:hypothetical protein
MPPPVRCCDAAVFAALAERNVMAWEVGASIFADPLTHLPDDCGPNRPPIYAMRKNGVTEVTGAIFMFIDDEGRARGVTAHNVSVDAFRCDVRAYLAGRCASDWRC